MPANHHMYYKKAYKWITESTIPSLSKHHTTSHDTFHHICPTSQPISCMC